MSFPAIPSRLLDRAELAQLVEELALRPELWLPHAASDSDARHYASLHRDAHLDVWALYWMPDNDTGWHDHDTSSGAVRVVRGALVEHALRVDGPHPRRRYEAGQTFSFDAAHIHRLTCSEPRSVSLHAYSPPLWRLGQYSVSGDGVLHRLSVSYADELRPIEVDEAKRLAAAGA